jgi:hypothetical protein
VAVRAVAQGVLGICGLIDKRQKIADHISVSENLNTLLRLQRLTSDRNLRVFQKVKMGRELQKKKNRSSVSKSRPKVSKRTKTGRMKVNFGNNKLLSENWYVSNRNSSIHR